MKQLKYIMFCCVEIEIFNQDYINIQKIGTDGLIMNLAKYEHCYQSI